MINIDKQYKILQEKPDLIVKIYGSTPENLFLNAALFIADILTKNNKILKNKQEESINISSFDINSLFIDFLNSLLNKSYLNKRFYLVSKINVFDSFLEAKLEGYSINILSKHIKTVLYDKVNICNKNGNWQTCLVFGL
jgi:SHS2 domain-containing protein